MSENSYERFLSEASRVVPTKRQLNWFEVEQYAFIHFGVNTFTDKEWGDGTESEEIFNPQKLDCDQWVDAIKSAGLKGMILTAKHHDGFCLWPSKYTEHSVKNSPCKKDIVKEASDACRRGGIKFGFYLSPWDRNCELYGTPEYNDYFCNQLTELLTGYGEIFHVWFDGACGEGPNGKKQVYDYKRYFELIRKYQPNATIFNDNGPDVRWCGNEAGKSRESEWAVVPTDLCKYGETQTGSGPLSGEADLSYMYNSYYRIGDMNQILYAKGLAFVPSEIDTSIRTGWFWHKNEEPKSLQELVNIYLNSVGNNACLNLNIPPTTDGLIDERDVQRLKEYGEFIKENFSKPVNYSILESNENNPRLPQYILKLDRPISKIRYVSLSEDLSLGQQVESFLIYGNNKNSIHPNSWFPLYQGYCIGNKKICCLVDPFAIQNPLLADRSGTDELVIKITSARGKVTLKDIKVF